VRSHVTFKAPRFNRTEVHPHFINECCFGEDCIAWLIAELRARGWTDVTEPWQEDWGWQTSGERGGRRASTPAGSPTRPWYAHCSTEVGTRAS
jgi:hypothetical protein